MSKTTAMTKKTFEQYDAEHVIVYFNESESEMPAMQEGENGQTVYQYDTVKVKCDTVSVDAIKQALVENGYNADEAEAIAAGVMLQAVQDGTVEGDALELAKQMVVARITAYDKSEAVNQFTYGGVPMWLDKATRAGLQLRLSAEAAASHENTTLWLDTQSFTLPVASAQQMLVALELYASACFDRTESHKAAVKAKRSVNTVLSYDYTADYPEKLAF